MDYLEVAKHILELLPMPEGCSLLAEASHHGEVDGAGGAFKIRRNLRLDVSKRIPTGTSRMADAEMCSDDEQIYLELQHSLRRAFAKTVLSYVDAKPYPLRTSSLSCDRGADIEIFLFNRGSLIVRSALADQEEGVTTWKIDLFLVVYDC